MTIIQEQSAAGRDGDVTERIAEGWNHPFKIHRHAGPAPYIWHGMRFGHWLKLLKSGGFDITFNCLPRILGVTAIAPFNSGFHYLSKAIYGRRAERTVVDPPVFIIGHWRTGTTFLHELLASNPSHGFPTTYQCFFPNSFLITERVVGALTGLLLPGTRPSDNMTLGFDRPQEEEFALANLGMGTPYLSLAFPRHGARGMRYLDLVDLNKDERAAWEAAFTGLVKRLQFAHGKRLILKSPLHTARIPTILKLFPNARFIHMSRDPFDIYPSTLHTWKAMGSVQGLHNPLPEDDAWLRDYVLEVFDKLFTTYERDRLLIPKGHLIEARYEDLVANPKAVLRDIYRRLELGDFAEAEPGIDAYLEPRKDYRRNVHDLSDDDRRMIRERWAPYFTRFGYDEEEALSVPRQRRRDLRR